MNKALEFFRWSARKMKSRPIFRLGRASVLSLAPPTRLLRNLVQNLVCGPCEATLSLRLLRMQPPLLDFVVGFNFHSHIFSTGIPALSGSRIWPLWHFALTQICFSTCHSWHEKRTFVADTIVKGMHGAVLYQGTVTVGSAAQVTYQVTPSTGTWKGRGGLSHRSRDF